MISTDFAANESWDDAWLSLKLLFQPWKWREGVETDIVKKEIQKLIGPIYQLANGRENLVHLFLSGRSALYFLLKSLNLPKNSAVLIQAFTCEAVVLPILANKLKPVYVDIETDTFSMDYRQLINRLTDNSRVLILQHTFGLTPKSRKEILNLAQNRNLIVIEDLAHGFSKQLTINNQQSYFLLSFGRSKMLSSVFGGAIISTDNRLTKKLNNQVNYLSFPSYWFIFRCLLYKPLVMLIKSTYDIFYLGKILHKIIKKLDLLIPEITQKEKNGRYEELFNKTYPNALIILLLHQLNKFDQIQINRAKVCAYYSRVILNVVKDLVPTKSGRNYASLDSSPRFAPFRMTDAGLIRFPLLVNNRDEIIKKARDQNIFFGTWYDQVVAPKGLNLDRVGYKSGSCPQAEEIAGKIINLPTNNTEKEAEKVVKIFFLNLSKD